MNIQSHDKQISTKPIKIHTLKYGSISVVLHIALVIILCSSALFVNQYVSEEGDNSIKAIMVDLSQIAAPKQSLVENVSEIKGAKKSDNHDNKKLEETKPVLQKPELSKPVQKENEIKLPVEKQEKPKQKETQQAIRQQVRQEVDSKNIAQKSVAPLISNNQKFAPHPSPIHRNHPQYPRRALDMGIEGHVRVKFDVNSEGEVENIRITESVPNNIFDREVIKAMKTWKYNAVVMKDIEIKIEFNRDKSITLNNE